MLRRSRCGQSSLPEYVIVFILVAGAVTAMSIYVQRAAQGRIYDAREHMISSLNGVGLSRNQPVRVAREYEPYYAYSLTNSTQRSSDNSTISGQDGYTKVVDQERVAKSESVQLPPCLKDNSCKVGDLPEYSAVYTTIDDTIYIRPDVDLNWDLIGQIIPEP